MSNDEAGAIPIPLVLLVEDEFLIREMVSQALEEAGFSPLAAGDGESAVLLLEQHRDELCGLVTDINLGNTMTGWDVARLVREHDADLPVVYVSGASCHEWASRGVPNSLLITKPFAPEQIPAALTALLVGQDTAA
ncbi:MAG: response regulator [Croceibacterium sp.]